VRPSTAGAAGHDSLAMVRACDEELELQPDRASAPAPNAQIAQQKVCPAFPGAFLEMMPSLPGQ
jgi:hypothetical protein